MMRGRVFFFVLCALFLMGGEAASVRAPYTGTETPRVRYLAPADEASVDLAGKGSLLFRWDRQQIPSGGRWGFRFRLYTEPDGKRILKRDLANNVFSVDVPASLFESGRTYSWRVQQRDDDTMNWSHYDSWRFTVIGGGSPAGSSETVRDR